MSGDIARAAIRGRPGRTSSSAAIPTCPAGSYLSAKIIFPGCGDGMNLDSADHRSHMAYR
jgi:hypothetical protein